jgi:hypothetical protein
MRLMTSVERAPRRRRSLPVHAPIEKGLHEPDGVQRAFLTSPDVDAHSRNRRDKCVHCGQRGVLRARRVVIAGVEYLTTTPLATRA